MIWVAVAMNRFMLILMTVLAAATVPSRAGVSATGGPGRAVYVHPGLLHARADLDFIRVRLKEGAQPWVDGFEKLRGHPQSKATWKLAGPYEVVRREPGRSHRIAEFDLDANAAYQNALMWCLTGDEAHARKSVEILDAWARTLTRIEGRDKELGASLGGFKFVNAAELMRHAYGGWARADVERFETFCRTVLYPVVQDFAPFANGNWGAGCIKTVMAIGIFCDDPVMVRRAADYYLRGAGNGCLTNYVINAAGQCQESGRDQQHAQLGLGHLAEVCEMAWNQGVDLYGFADNRLLKGFEYTARYNLGHEVPFEPHVDTTGKYRWKRISDDGRGRLRPVFEMVWNHYENRRGVPAPHTRQAAEKIRPEGAAHGADHPGFGTLLFTRPPRGTLLGAETVPAGQ